MTKFRYRKQFNEEWNTAKSLDDLAYVIQRLHPIERLEIRVSCDHKNTHVQDGIRSCKNCGDTIEVTSYRG